MSRWSPRELPRARRQTLTALDGLRAGLQAGAHAGAYPDRENVLDQIEQAGRHVALLMRCGMYWVTPHMTALAVSAGRTLPEVSFGNIHRPEPIGLLVWDGGAVQSTQQQLKFQDRRLWRQTALGATQPPAPVLPLDAVSWGPHPDGLEVTGWVARDQMVRALAAAGYPTDAPQQAPPLIPDHSTVIPAHSAAHDPAEFDGHQDRALLLTLAAAWQLMQQPTLAERTIRRPDRDDARRAARVGYSDPDVTIVDLRQIYRPQEPRDDEGAGSSRTYRYRWVVSGHWRQQPFGKDRAQRRQQWIPSHTKGPDGAPLLETERVNVWRR